MLRLVPPAGAPLEFSQIAGALKTAFLNGVDASSIRQEFARRLGVPHALPTVSGRTALQVIIRALHSVKPDRNIVAVPAYVCFSVPSAIARAGLAIQPVEIDSDSLEYDFADLERLPAKGLLCIVAANLFGLMNDTNRIQQIAHAKGAFLVDDAAQALGATREGYPAGTRGDVGLYSFGRGKVLANLEGGLVVTRSNAIAAAVKREIERLPVPAFGHNLRLMMRLLVYAAFLHPHLYWIPSSLPILKLGVTEFDPNYPAAQASELSLAVSHRLLPKVEQVTRTRQRIAGEVTRWLRGHQKFTVPKVPPECQPSFIRFPLIARDEATRREAIVKLRKAGISATPFYPSAICDIEGIDRYVPSRDFHKPQAESLSRRLLTLPTSAYLKGKDLERMASALWSI